MLKKLNIVCMLQEVLLTSANGSPEFDQAKTLLHGSSISLLLSKLCRCLEDSAQRAPPSGESLFSVKLYQVRSGNSGP